MQILLVVEDSGNVKAGVQCRECNKWVSQGVPIPRVLRFALKGVPSGTKIGHGIPGTFICERCEPGAEETEANE